MILQSLPGHSGAVTSACILPHPEVIVTGALDAEIRVWANKTYQVSRERRRCCNRREVVLRRQAMARNPWQRLQLATSSRR